MRQRPEQAYQASASFPLFFVQFRVVDSARISRYPYLEVRPCFAKSHSRCCLPALAASVAHAQIYPTGDGSKISQPPPGGITQPPPFSGPSVGPPGSFNPDFPAALDANGQFAFDLYTRLSEKPGNKLLSPFGISNVLAMTCAGAKGQTADDMAKTLHFTLPGARLHPAFGEVNRSLQIHGPWVEGPGGTNPAKLTTISRLWAQNGLTIRPEFLRIAQTDYQSSLQLVDFKKDPEASRKTINRWVEQQTNDKIKDLVQPGTIKTPTRLLLTNASCFKGNWAIPFGTGATKPDDFTIPGKPAFKVPMMWQEMRVAYNETDDFQVVKLPFAGDQFSMMVILPKKMDGLAAVEKELSAKLLDKLFSGPGFQQRYWPQVVVALPKFKLTEEFQLQDELAAMGMRTAFSAQADFSTLADTSVEKLKIDAVIHKASVEVTEAGTEAPGAGHPVFFRAGDVLNPQPRQPILFRADHPFLFAIRHNRSILFLGRVNDPR